MILSLILGNQNASVNNDWEITTDDYKNTFIENKSIRQKIRLGANVEKKLDVAFSSSCMKGFDIASSIFFSNNYKNMNLMLMNFWNKNKKIMKEHVDSHILYITFLCKNYKLLEYATYGNDVVQTYRKKDDYQGLVLRIDQLDGSEVFSMVAKDLSSNRFVEIVVTAGEDGKLMTEKKPLQDREKEIWAKNLCKKNKNFHFLMDIGTIPTNTFIVDASLKESVIKEITKDIEDANILVLPDGSNSFSEDKTSEEKEALSKMFTDALTEKRIRAVTLIGCKVPYSFCRDYNILYLFNYDLERKYVTCLKSN